MISSRLDGELVLGPRSAGSAGVGRVPLEGATLLVDPAEPGLLGQLTIFDDGLSKPLIDALWWHEDPGIDASTLLLPPPRADRSLAAAHALSSLLHVGVLFWLESWSPDDLDPVLLDLEVGQSTASATLVADGEEIARSRLIPRIPDLLGLAERIRGREAPVAPPTAALVRQALSTTHDLMTENDPGFDDVEHELELAVMLAAADQPWLDWDDRSSLFEIQRQLLGGRTLDRALSADAVSDDNTTASVGRTSVDWLQIPRGLLDTAESTVSWTLDRRAGSVNISVKASERWSTTGAPDRGLLAFRVVATDGAVVGVGPLSYARSDGAFVGSCRVDEVNRIQIDVFDPALIRPPRIGPAAAVATAERWAARAVSLLRLSLAADRADEARRASDLEQTLQLLQYAARLAESATNRAPTDWQPALQARQIQLLDCLHALASIEGRSFVQRRAAATIARLGRQPSGGTPTVALTATEWALVARLPAG